MQVLQCWVLQLPLTLILWKLKTCYTHYHNHRRHHCHLLFTALVMPLQFISAQNKSDQIDCACSDNTTSWAAPRGQTLPIWLKETLTEFCVCVCVWERDAVARVFGLGRSVMLVISNLLWFQSSTSCISTVWGLNSCHWHCVRVYILRVCVRECMQVCVCVCAFWHFKKLCGGNVKTLYGVCVWDAALPLPLWGDSVFPATVHQSTLSCLGRRQELSLSLSFHLFPLSPSMPPSSPPLHLPLSFFLSLTRSLCASCCLPVNIYSPLYTGTEVVGCSQRRKRGCISQM